LVEVNVYLIEKSKKNDRLSPEGWWIHP